VSGSHAQGYGSGPQSETDRQSFQIPEWAGSPGGQSFPDGDADTDDLGSYCPINLPPNPGPRAADVLGPGNRAPGVPTTPSVFDFPHVGMGNRNGGSGGMYG
jgi:hypothetical protein